MRTRILSSLALTLLLAAAGCKKDNYDAPATELKGRIVYNGKQLGVRSNGVQLELWQPGFALSSKIPVFIAQDGSFSVKLFNGSYKLVGVRGNGPWANFQDSIPVTVSGNGDIDVQVDPYFVFQDATFQHTATTVTVTFTIMQVNPTQPLESVTLYVGNSKIVDVFNRNVAVTKVAADITNILQPQTLTLTLPADLVNNSFVYARVGIKAVGVGEQVYTPAELIQLK
jgi:hypothetical protein